LPVVYLLRVELSSDFFGFSVFFTELDFLVAEAALRSVLLCDGFETFGADSFLTGSDFLLTVEGFSFT
jgi:hypothetical protein